MTQANQPTSEVIEKAEEIAVYSEFETQLIELEGQSKSLVFDYVSKSGNKDARSHVAKLRKTKKAIDRARLDHTKELRDKVKAVNDAGTAYVERVEALIAPHVAKLDRVKEAEEGAEQARIDERERIEREQELVRQTQQALDDKAEAAEAERVADEAHRNNIEKEILKALVDSVGLSEYDADKVMDHLGSDSIPHVTINY